MDTILFNILYVFGFASVLSIGAWILRRRYEKQVVGKVKVVMIPSLGQVMTALCKYEDEIVTVAWDGVKLLEGSVYKDVDANEQKKSYEYKDGDAVDSLWPYETGFMKFLSVQVPMLIYKEGNLVPLTRNDKKEIECECGNVVEVIDREPQIITPRRLWQKLNTQYRSVRNIQSEKTEKDKQLALDAMAKMIHPYVVYGAIFVAVSCLVILIYLYMGVGDDIEQIKYGLGME